jgi:hypothetical protein
MNGYRITGKSTVLMIRGRFNRYDHENQSDSLTNISVLFCHSVSEYIEHVTSTYYDKK